MNIPPSVFEVLTDIPEIDARRGDRIYVDPNDPDLPYAIVRPISHAEARWAFSDRCRRTTRSISSEAARESGEQPARQRAERRWGMG